MNEFFQNWSSEINTQTERVNALISTISLGKLNEKPSPKKWSIGELIEHLLVTNRQYFGILSPITTGKSHGTKYVRIKFIQRKLGKMILKAVSPNITKKVKTLRIFEPERSNLELSVADEFRKQQEQLKEIVKQLEGIDIENTYINSPVGGMIIYSVRDALSIILEHEKRHIGQAEKLNQE